MIKLKLKYLNTIPILILFILVISFFFSFFFPKPKLLVTPDFGLSDVWNLNYPYKDNLSQNLKQFKFPLWSEKIATGYPVFAEGQTGTLNMINLILFFLFPTWLAYNLGYISIFLTTAIGTYWYCRVIKLSKISSLWAAIIFTFSGVFTARLQHYNLIQTASFLPIIFALTELIIQKKRLLEPFILSFIFAQQYFSGFPQIIFITMVTQIIYIVLKIYFEKEKFIKIIIYFLLSYALFAGLSAIQFLPSFELINNSARGAYIPFSEITRFPLELKHLLLFFNPFMFGNPAYGTYPHFSEGQGIYWENIAYIGLIPILFFIINIFNKKVPKKLKSIFFIIITFFLLLSLGKNSPLFLFFNFFPFNLFRVPSRFLLPVVFFMAVFSSIFLERFKIIFKVNFPNLFLVLLFSVSIWQLFNFGKNFQPLSDVKKWLDKPQIAVSLGKTSRIYSLPSYEYWNSEFQKNGWQNTEKYYYLRNNLQPNINLVYNISHLDIYPVLKTRRHQLITWMLEKNIKINHDIKSANITTEGLKILQINSVTHLTSPYPLDNSGLILEKTIYGNPKYYLYKIIDSYPRYRLSNKYKITDNLDDLIVLVSKNQNNKIILEKKPKIKITENKLGTINLIEENEKYSRLKIISPTNTILIKSTGIYPGWSAKIDGKNSEIYIANINQQAIFIPSGQHLVEFNFTSSSFNRGAIISSVTFCILIFLIIKQIYILKAI